MLTVHAKFSSLVTGYGPSILRYGSSNFSCGDPIFDNNNTRIQYNVNTFSQFKEERAMNFSTNHDLRGRIYEERAT